MHSYNYCITNVYMVEDINVVDLDYNKYLYMFMLYHVHVAQIDSVNHVNVLITSDSCSIQKKNVHYDINGWLCVVVRWVSAQNGL